MTNQTSSPDAMIEDMAALLEESDVAEPRQLRRGEVVEGTVMGLERDGVLVDIGFKSEGIVPQGEMHSLGADPLTKVTVGEKVLVYVLQPETAEGQVALSIDRARGEQGWRVLQERFEAGDIFEAEVTGYNKGGLLANVEGVNAFIPMSQVGNRCVLVPEKIELSVGWWNPELDPDSRIRKIAPFFELSATAFDRAIAETLKQGEAVKFPGATIDRNALHSPIGGRLAVFTDIQTYGQNRILPNESGLTTPLLLAENPKENPGLKIGYALREKPAIDLDFFR